MPTRKGKIAHLPHALREQLNLRLHEGQTGRELAAWLNALPEVQSILGSQFNGSNISEVNLTHWRQGGYLQWLTERECFDSARALAEGDRDFATSGLTAERLLNVLTLRYGQILMRWDLPLEEGVSEAAAFAEMAKKARILLRITRSVLAIHRIQSQSASSKTGRESRSESQTNTASAALPKPAPTPNLPSKTHPATSPKPEPALDPAVLRSSRAARGGAGVRPEILSGQISPSSTPVTFLRLHSKPARSWPRSSKPYDEQP